ncbi:hypothetical protein KI387_004238, partial [Taxus chinensis]
MKKAITTSEIWRIVEDYCCTHGLLHTASQCRDQWEHVLPDYKRVRDYEAHIPFGHDSYWSMKGRERVEKKLPTNFAMELFNAMDISFGSDRAINPSKISIDTFDTQYVFTEGWSSPIENEPLKEFETLAMTGESSLNTGKEKEKLSTCKKRKTSNKTSIKDKIVERNKLVIFAFQMAEEGRRRIVFTLSIFKIIHLHTMNPNSIAKMKLFLGNASIIFQLALQIWNDLQDSTNMQCIFKKSKVDSSTMDADDMEMEVIAVSFRQQSQILDADLSPSAWEGYKVSGISNHVLYTGGTGIFLKVFPVEKQVAMGMLRLTSGMKMVNISESFGCGKPTTVRN